MIQKITIVLIFIVTSFQSYSQAQHSIARQWNEKLLEAISGDFARPTVHARNLFHTSIAMYDAWAIYGKTTETYLLGKNVHGFQSSLGYVPPPADVKAAQREAISYAAYRLIKYRFRRSNRSRALYETLDNFMLSLGYDPGYTNTNYACGPAAMGNHIAATIIEYGLQDGSNDANDYQNVYYEPVNPPLPVTLPASDPLVDLNRWQPLQMNLIIDQSGNPIAGNLQTFLSPEWGNVQPFSLQQDEAKVYSRNGHQYIVYHDPGPPALIDKTNGGPSSEFYKWNHELVAIWSSQLDPSDGVFWDISPGSIGNLQNFPSIPDEYQAFYDLEGGGDNSPGHSVNPKTGQPYAPQIVPRGDYARVLAEFWADGPSSTTPPGHWFEILNYVSDQPGFERRWRGQGPLLDTLEWDLKSYFALGGAMHDCAIAAWGIKGWYDSSRPVTALRGMAVLGQSSDPALPNYHPGGLRLMPGFVEMILPGDPLSPVGQYIGEVKIRAWRGPEVIQNPFSEVAGVGWIRAKTWWPYQRPTFVSPPFGGYVSGHSTYSRAAAEVLTAITGDPFFPGGMGTFSCPKNAYLVFEDGPSEDITLQWATYRDASDQCSLSRIWGGIHPPMDDIPGRLIGMEIGPEALAFAEQYFVQPDTTLEAVSGLRFYPNPTSCMMQVAYEYEGWLPVDIYAATGQRVQSVNLNFINSHALLNLMDLNTGVYFVIGRDGQTGQKIFEEKLVKF